MRRYLIVAAVLAPILAGCGAASRAAPTGGHTAAATAPVAVIRAWSQALARGDIAAAAAYFAIPSSVQVDPTQPPATVRSAADARAVNVALPCGAKLLGSRPVGGYVDALFLLSSRPGADCGGGVGGTGRVAFVISAGRIAVWRRIADEPGDAARAAPGFRQPTAPGALPPGTSSV